MFTSKLALRTEEVEEILTRFLPKEEGLQKTVLEAMNYSLLAGGKRLRPMLLQETYRMFGGVSGPEEPFMAAIEMIHTYSLVHDDLPAMDNDEYRRGRLTTWKVYGDATGVLAGDGLLNLAFETALLGIETGAGDGSVLMERLGGYRRGVSALSVLARKAGVFGMIGGQMADLEAEGHGADTTKEELLFIHEHKTACLIQAALMMGAILAGADEEMVRAMERCGYNVGIAFQIQDDILDIVGTQEELGKPIGSDAANDKTTYVTLNGLEASKQEVARLSQEALDILAHIPGEHDFLDELIASLVGRTK